MPTLPAAGAAAAAGHRGEEGDPPREATSSLPHLPLAGYNTDTCLLGVPLERSVKLTLCFHTLCLTSVETTSIQPAAQAANFLRLLVSLHVALKDSERPKQEESHQERDDEFIGSVRRR